MNKKLLGLIACCAMATLTFVGCGGGANTVDLNTVADELLEKAGYEDELVKVEPSVVENIYFIDNDDVSDMVVYMSSNNSTPEEIALLKAKNAKSAEELETAVNGRLEELKISFENYAPNEVYKIENAVVKVDGNYILMTICPDNESADKVLSNAM